jgi:hypothetical protein
VENAGNPQTFQERTRSRRGASARTSGVAVRTATSVSQVQGRKRRSTSQTGCRASAAAAT